MSSALEAGHGEHVFEEAGIVEGDAPVPKWFLWVLGFLYVVAVVYLVTYLVGAQPSSAQIQ